MSERDKGSDRIGVWANIPWEEALDAARLFLHPDFPLPPGVTDEQLQSLWLLVGNARARLLEQKRG